jgi:two-component system, NarL family, nitrate/nitrite response regulator NarL
MLQSSLADTIRLYVVDDHALFREGLMRLLAGDSTFEVVGSAESPPRALRPLLENNIDVLMLDYDLNGHCPADFLRDLKTGGFAGRVLLVTAGLPDRDALNMIKLGVAGIFHKQHPPDELRRSIREVHEGNVLIDQIYFQKLVSAVDGEGEARAPKLTEREQRILRYLFEGLANKEIATQLGISESAVKAALQQLFAKTGVRTRSQLVRVALEEYRDVI